ncbi:MAG: site-specific DNA-methyltransferase [Phycisphaerae bacterium]|nr:site-specific DNA-methyltransferase [Phycisphaerae bacterium]
MLKFTDKIICGDCIELLGSVEEPFIDLVFADPPFNIGYNYDKYKDKLESKNFVAWTRDWMEACVNALKPNGSFYIAIGDDYAAHIRLIGEELGMELRNWIIWHYTFGQQTKTKFARAHTHIFYFVKDKDNYTFNDHAVRVPSDRQLIYNDKRSNPEGKMPDDVWNTYSRVCGTFSERQKWHPCQMPESLLTRIISVSSNPGDLILDPFNGSGTTASAALQLDRKYCGIDISENYVDNTRTRLRNLKNQIRKKDSSSDIFNARETLEIKRLFIDMAIPVKEINASKKLLGLFTQQFGLRMSNDKTYDQKDIAAALLEFTAYDQKAKSKN